MNVRSGCSQHFIRTRPDLPLDTFFKIKAPLFHLFWQELVAGAAPPEIRTTEGDAVAFGDGFFGAGSSTTAQFAEQVRILREELARAERDPATFRIAKRVYIAVDDDDERARQRVAAALDPLYGDFGLAGRLLPVAVTGTPHDCLAGLHAVAAAGAQRILFNPLFDEREQMERLAAEVMPHLT